MKAERHITQINVAAHKNMADTHSGTEQAKRPDDTEYAAPTCHYHSL